MVPGIIGKKLGMTQVFGEHGKAEPVTVIEAGPCAVTQVKTSATEGYDAVQLGFGQAKKLTKAEAGHVKELGKFKHLREFRTSDAASSKVGDKVDVSLFKPGDVVDVVGQSKGKGFAGVVKRHHFAGGPKTHGQSDRHRAPGAIGATTTPGRVLKGLRMAGHMGDERVTVRRLEVYRIDPERNLLVLRARYRVSAMACYSLVRRQRGSSQMQAPVYNLAGEVVDNIEINDKVFATPFNEDVVHQAVLRQQANARQGTASTKTRGDVGGSSKKLYRQKGTGSARAGNIKSPLRRGGGVVFGPHPRDYRQAMPKKMHQLALRCAISAKVSDGELRILQSLALEEPRTRLMAGVLGALKVESSALVVTSEARSNLVKSARNIPGIKTMPANLLNVVDLLSHKTLLMEVSAVRKAEQIWGKENSGEETNATA